MPYITPAQFVGREKEIEDYLRLVEELESNGVARPIWNMYALTGMGKTWLAYTLYNRIVQELAFGCVWISFEPSAPLPEQSDPLEREEVLKPEPASSGLERSLKLSPLGHTATDLLSFPPSFDRYEVIWRGHAAPGRPFVLILDGLNQLETSGPELGGEVWVHLQRAVITPLVSDQNRVGVLCVSQLPLRWNSWDLIAACQPRRLDPLSYDETDLLLSMHDLQDSARIIYTLTQGHPASIAYIINETEGALGDRVILDERPAFAEAENTQYQEIHQQIDLLAPFARQLIEVIGILRRVDVETIRYVIKHLPLHAPTPVRTYTIHRALAQYIEHGILLTDVGSTPFRFSQEVSMVIESDLSQNAFEQLERLCSILSTWYFEELQAKPLTKKVYFVEWMYFSIKALSFSFTRASTPEERSHKKQAWTHHFRKCWERSGSDDTKQALYNDHMVISLLRSVDLEQRVNNILFGYSIDQNKDQYRQALVNYLFNYRFPRRLSDKERTVLEIIANDIDSKPFDFDDLQKVISLSDRLTSKPSSVNIRRYLSTFNEIHAISYDDKVNKFVMDKWLGNFLKEKR